MEAPIYLAHPSGAGDTKIAPPPQNPPPTPPPPGRGDEVVGEGGHNPRVTKGVIYLTLWYITPDTM